MSSDEVFARSVSTALVARLDAHRLTVHDRGQSIAAYPVGVGKRGTRTPTGAFTVTGVLKSPNPGGAYGPYAIGTSALTDTLTDWPGGGVVGIHGTNQPGSVGGDASHGYIRLHNSDVTELARRVGLGTPVFIRP